ncbi:ABC transporter substrate-binding protein [Nocardioides baekrokdamisoli]|uniref:ABC transporter substrate-binding protein n=1 Tax=Nocardioides baekrokdamisoli TaxID=1804624 RepID=A0A3G9IX50_9ACTN|nr:MlaD family protein [Nocardioides baekrokdamisoli]BBH16953.1 ABC transporter substrate-binding protein [Nocardioides baekrokdamisoli]
MITRRVKIQLMIFLLLTVSGVAFVGAKYANLGTLFYKDHYTVTANFKDSGGIYKGAEVDYRGVMIGTVGNMTLTPTGVDLALDIKNKWKSIPNSDVVAVVANRSAVGEQYVDLQPCSKLTLTQANQCPTSGPFLADGSVIKQDHTVIPISTATFLGDTDATVRSIDKGALATSVRELGAAFVGTGNALGQILDTSNSFVHLADQNFGVTTALIKDGNTVLSTQVGQTDAIRAFAQDLSLFSDTLAGANPDVIRLLENGSAGALQLKQFLDQYGVDLGTLISQSLTTGQIIQQNIPGLRQILVLYPYVVEGGFSVVGLDPGTGDYRASFGLAIQNNPVCSKGYESTAKRPPQDGSTRIMNTNARCTEPITQSDPRGTQNAPRAPIATYDTATKQVTWAGSNPSTAQSSWMPTTLAGWLYGPLVGGH